MEPADRTTADVTFASDLRAAWETVREKLWLILLCALLGGGLAFLHAQRSPKVYASQVTVQVENAEQKILKIDGVTSDDLKSTEVLTTLEQNFTTPALLNRVIERNNLEKDAGFLPEVARPASIGQLREVLAGRVTAKVRRGTRLIDVKVEDRNAEMAQHIARLLVRELEQQGYEDRLATSQAAHAFLVEQAERLNERLAKSSAALQAYKEKNADVSLEDRQNASAEKMKELNQRVTEAKAARLKLETDHSLLEKLGTASVEPLLNVPSVAASGPVVDLKRTIAEKETALATLRQRYLPEHPAYIRAQSELDGLRASLDQAVRRGAELVASSYTAAVETEKKMEEALRELSQREIELSKLAIPYQQLLRDVESDRVLYESVLTRLKETDVTRGVTQSPFRTISRPLLPERPIKPNKPQILAAGILAGLAVGLGLTALQRLFDGSIKTSDDAESRLGLRALGIIPDSAEMKSRRMEPVLSAHPESPAAEAFRALRTSLSLLGKGGSPPKTFLFTSAVPAEGKSSCAINCAMAFAQQGLKTLLIDADIRIPTLATTFFGSEQEHGLTDVLTHQLRLAEAIRDPGVPHLHLLCAGSRSKTPAEVLGNGEFPRIIARARSDFDRVVIDCAPVHAVPDTLIIAGHTDATVLVIKAGRTPAQACSRAVRKLNDAGARPAGFIFNRVPARGLEYYDQRYSLAGYGPRAGKDDAPTPQPTRDLPAPAAAGTKAAS
jgi:capsular exopolysaccharide synthesis family protein